MRKSLVVGILKEMKAGESRSPLTPSDVLWLRKRKIKVEVESSPGRVFKDSEYSKHGAKVVKKFEKASLLIGIKEPDVFNLCSDKIYAVFSHTAKGQAKNMPLLKESKRKKITLIDYEKIVDSYGRRLVFFGRFAGICGTANSLYLLGKRLEWEKIRNPFVMLKPTSSYDSLTSLKKSMASVGEFIRKKGLPRKTLPFIIGVTGHGNVSKGINEMLEPLCPIEIHPKDMKKFVRHQKHMHNRVYKIVFYREEKLRSKKRKGFYFEDYLAYPRRFESNLDTYLPHLNLLLHGSYWDKSYPRLVTMKTIHRLYGKDFRLKFIGDISCDVNGSIELTYKTTTVDAPTFTYDPEKDQFIDGYESNGITILARDNLPTELPKDASRDFGVNVREYVYQIAAHGVRDITNHVAIPKEIRQAVIVQGRRLTKPYGYLKKYL
jgi:alpha-aminoadipic semialdehyde synthase